MFWKSHFRHAIVCLGVALACGAIAGPALADSPAPDPMQAKMDRMDSYFLDGMRSPEVFRALSGMGDPQIEHADYAEYAGYSHWANSSPEETEAAKQLFPDVDPSSSTFTYDIGDCRPEAPVRILVDRVKQFGADHPYVKQWIAVERVVLSACAKAPQKPATLPAPLVTDDAAMKRLQAYDRAYQQASLSFYENDLPNALKAYGAVAADKASPDRPLAVYMVTAIRAGSYAHSYGHSKPMVSTAQAIKEAKAILADPSLVSVHTIAAQLMGWIAAEASDDVSREAQVHEVLTALEASLAKLKSSAIARERYSVALSDITSLHHDFADEDWWLNGAVPDDYTASIAMARAARTDPLAAWMVFPESPFMKQPWATVEHSYELPHDTANYRTPESAGTSDPWVHRELSFSNPIRSYGIDISRAEDLVDDEIERAKKSDDDEAMAALPFDFYDLVRLSLMNGATGYGPPNPENFRKVLDGLQNYPFKSTHAYHSAVHDGLQYLITKGYLVAARQLRDRLHLDAKGRPEMEVLDENCTELLLVLAEDENHLVRVLNNGEILDMPQYLQDVSIEELWRLAARSELPRNERSVFARTAWARLYALGRTIDAKNDRLMRDLNPETTKNWHSQPGADVEPGNHIVLADVLASPGLNILLTRYESKAYGIDEFHPGPTGMDHFNHDDANWWCPWKLDLNARELDANLDGNFGPMDYSDTHDYRAVSVRQSLFPALRESFVFRSYNQGELAALSKIDCAPKMLSARVIDWVKHPGWFDSTDLQPEALANAVAATHWGCYSQGSHAAYSREAFMLLHSKFPQSAAAKRTKYWYGCVGFGDCTKKDPLVTPSSH